MNSYASNLLRIIWLGIGFTCLTLPAWGQITYRLTPLNTLEITGYPKDAVGVVEIPAEINGRPVDRIAPRAFSDCTGITHVDIPDSVKTINLEAFARCTGLTSVTLPSSVETVRDGVFSGCTSLTSLSFEEGFKYIGNRMFSDCTALTHVTIPASVISIGSQAFSGCTSLLSMDVDPDNPVYSSVDGVLFNKDQTSLIQYAAGKFGNYDIPPIVTYIAPGAFRASSGLTSVTIPLGISTIAGETFSGCTGLSSVSIPDSVVDIDDGAFFNCERLASVTLPLGLTEIGHSAFRGCGSLTSIVIPPGVTRLENETFAACVRLESVTIPDSVTRIGIETFAACISLPTVIIPDSVTYIDQGAFAACTGLTRMIIPDSVTEMSVGVFRGCTELNEVVLGNGLTGISGQTFRGCTGLTSITIPPGVTEIWPEAFRNCTGLESVTLPEGLVRLHAGAFAGCTRLSEITIPSTVNTIGDQAFEGCTGLIGVTLPNGLTRIRSRLFAGCTQMAHIDIPAGITELHVSAFDGCTALESIDVDPENSMYSSLDGVLFDGAETNLLRCPQGKTGHYIVAPTVTQIRSGAFWNCIGLTGITLPSGITSVGESAFANCIGLTHMTWPDSLTEIPRYAFSGCTGLTDMSLPVTTTHIRVRAFEGCTSLTDQIIPQNVVAIESAAFAGCTGLTSFDVDLENPNHSSVDGVLFNKDQTSLLQFPPGKAGHYDIPSSVTEVRWGAFHGCTGLTSVTLPSGFDEITDFMFRDCTGLTRVDIPASVRAIEEDAFMGCTGLTRMTLSSNIQFIVAGAFRGCTSLSEFEVDPENPKFSSVDGVLFNKDQTSLLHYPGGKSGPYIVPSGVTGIGAAAFSGCTGLTSISLPASVVSIHGYPFFQSGDPIDTFYAPYYPNPMAFGRCTGLLSFDVDPQNPAFSSIDGVLFDNTRTLILQYPAGRTGPYTIPSGVTMISGLSFHGCTGLTKVTIPASVTTIVVGAFSDCTELTQAVFLGNAVPLRNSAFDNTAPNFTIYHPGRSTGFGYAPSESEGGFFAGLDKILPIVMLDEVTYPAATWLSEYSLSFDTDILQDINGDGVDLLMAFALNLDPRLDLLESLPSAELDEESLSIRFHANALGINYLVETSIDMDEWTTTGVNLSAPDMEGRRKASVPRDVDIRFLRLGVSY